MDITSLIIQLIFLPIIFIIWRILIIRRWKFGK